MKIYILLTVLVLGFLVSGCFNGDTEQGLLQGTVSIGPLTPVEIPGQELNINCEAYEARKITIYDDRGDRLIAQVDIECNSDENRAFYQVWLEPGVYVVDINHIGVDSSDDVPKTIEIISGATVKLDIDIDTGIR